MEKFKDFTGQLAPLDRVNVDTDQIIPKQFLKKIERTGFGQHLFHDWRFTDDDGQKENEQFVLNRDPYRHAPILLAGDNFGCGSSREHAPWALQDYGIKVILSTSFADIFYQNSIKNGILPVILTEEASDYLFKAAAEDSAMQLKVSLTDNTISHGDWSYTFTMDKALREALIEGLDDIANTMKYMEKITAFEEGYNSKYPFYNVQIKRGA